MSPLWRRTNQTNIESGNGRNKCNQVQVSALDNAVLMYKLLILKLTEVFLFVCSVGWFFGTNFHESH